MPVEVGRTLMRVVHRLCQMIVVDGEVYQPARYFAHTVPRSLVLGSMRLGLKRFLGDRGRLRRFDGPCPVGTSSVHVRVMVAA